MIRAGRNHNRHAVIKLVFIAVNNALALAIFNAEKLGIVRMNFPSDFFIWFEIHQNQLAVLRGVKNFAIIIIFQSFLLNVYVKSFHGFLIT